MSVYLLCLYKNKEDDRMTNDCFRLKGSVMTTFILEFNDFDSEKFKQQLKQKVDSSPEFFQQSPVIIDFSKLDLQEIEIDYLDILSTCREYGLQPTAFHHHENLDLNAIKETNLAVIKQGSSKAEKKSMQESLAHYPDTHTKIINKPIRSGQQIYAEGTDLIILGSVSGGAEVLADGNIHIYGSLRGRALAGVKGNNEARIFCTNNEAELVSINGHFLVSDALETQTWKQPAQFYLIDETLHVGAL